MLIGRKLVENRSWRIPPGWYALHVGAQRDSNWHHKAMSVDPSLPGEEQLADHFSSIVGLLRMTEGCSIEQCNGHPWAFGPVCHVISHAIYFAKPIKSSGASGLWDLTRENKAKIEVQLRDGNTERRCNDLSPLGSGGPNVRIEKGSSKGGTKGGTKAGAKFRK
eukprot:gnl/MRDRNA2_/MRDRNA2_66975_c0_seq2.p1 gnl/MRDRNA2_/MRDRNA2_66975_c0~~gnl/MRDRNA2_/MRDRNA2_66975_c0_seq2.p1  ORF type:complete len:164 (-),score=20.16 gnl/MRDRNA2_/MRDRNA2_66975_c0_seq2:72-563(-)